MSKDWKKYIEPHLMHLLYFPWYVLACLLLNKTIKIGEVGKLLVIYVGLTILVNIIKMIRARVEKNKIQEEEKKNEN